MKVSASGNYEENLSEWPTHTVDPMLICFGFVGDKQGPGFSDGRCTEYHDRNVVLVFTLTLQPDKDF